MRQIIGISVVIVIVSTLALRVEGQSPATQPGNAAVQYWQAFAMLPEHAGDLDLAVADATKRPQWEGKLAVSMRFLQRGAAMETCDWGLDYDAGVGCPLPHLGRARSLGYGAIVFAEEAWQRGQKEDAMRTFGDALSLGRHVEDGDAFICRLVGMGIHLSVVKSAAPHLLTAPPQALQDLAQRLDRTPPPAGIHELVLRDKKLFLSPREHQKLMEGGKPELVSLLLEEGWKKDDLQELERDPRSIAQILDEVDRTWEADAELMALPPAQWQAADAKWAAMKQSAGPLVRLMVPNVSKMRGNVMAENVTMTMFRAAIAVALDGPEQLQRYPDPFTAKPFAYQPRGKGFELTSEFIYKDKAITLPVGEDAATADR